MYIRDGNEPIEIQTDFITLDKFPLPNLKLVKDIVASLTLSIPVDKDDNIYKFLQELSNFLLIVMVIKNFMSIFKQQMIDYF